MEAPVARVAGRSQAAAELGGLALLSLVAVAAAVIAHLYREAILTVVERFFGTADPTAANSAARPLVVFAMVTAGVLGAVWLGRKALANGRAAGLTSISAAARGEGAGPSMPATVIRSASTWLASVALGSLGRESAILESSGTLGYVAGRRTPFAPALAAGGVAAAFAAAYHAPIAGVLYVEGHLRVRHDRRAAVYTVTAAVIGHLVATRYLGGHPIFPGTQGSRWGMVLLGLVAIVPAALGSRLFLELRERLERSARAARSWVVPAGLAVVAGAVAAVAPLTSGNGMEALRHSATGAGVTVAVVLAIGKLASTSAVLGSGAPGGVFSPTLAVSAGWALLTFFALERLGVPLTGSHWDGMLVAMAVGVAVGLRAPLVAAVVVAEMTGDLTLVPLLAAAVGLGYGLERAADGWWASRGHRLPAELHDEDA